MCPQQLQKAIIQLTKEVTGTVVTSIKNDFRKTQKAEAQDTTTWWKWRGINFRNFRILFLFCPLL